MSTTQVSPRTRPSIAVVAVPSYANPVASEPIRADLYGLDRLEAHARQLAEASRATTRRSRGNPLLSRFFDNGVELARAHRHIIETTSRREPITTDAEWLLDNFHIIEDNLREVRQDLPRGYYEKLPKLAAGPYAGLPRVYALGIELIAHTDSSLDENNITRFVQAYQAETPLTIGELWAVPIMLRLGLLENLRRLAGQMLTNWDERRKAEGLALRLAEMAHGPEPQAADRALQQTSISWSDPCLVYLLQLLREHGEGGSAGIEWLERALDRRGVSRGEILQREHQRQASNQVSVGNCVTSLRLLSNLDWSVFFEHTSVVESLLRQDPAGVYARQDFATRDRYRRIIERLGRHSDADEVQVARRILELARSGTEDGGRHHVGYYLIGPGRHELEHSLRYRPSLGQKLLDTVLAHPNTVYFGSLILILALLMTGVLTAVGGIFAAHPGLVVLAALAALLPLSDLAVGLLHYLVTLLLPPRVLPKLDFKDGIAADCPTFVVMPTMLLRHESAAALTARLEVHYLSNPDPQLRFALLTDFADADTEHQPEDDDYVREALAHIKALNDRYAPGGPDRFFLFHRRRQWNPQQGCWMGWERKRGKLSEFNRLLRGATDTSYVVQSGDLTHLPRIRYVITLDADTQLPRESAQRLVAILAHPLNQARFDPEQGRVVEGYGILQPRVSLSLLAATRSLFSRIMAASAGIDPYTIAVSDVYQDLFGRGTFTGKGIYDVDAFEAAVGCTFPENHILSHDLIEGNYARCGLVTDVELLDDFPARYHAYARREHRWVRGDWQILPWVLPRMPAPDCAPGSHAAPGSPEVRHRDNPLPALERWKVLDNLRRSLVPPAVVVMLGLGWTVLPGSPWMWTCLAMAVLGLPLLLLLFGSFLALVRGGSWLLQLREIRGSLVSTGGQVLIQGIMLAEQARQMIDAIARTLVRLTVTHAHLLEWETAATTERRLGTGFVHFCSLMWGGPVVALVLGLIVGFVNLAALPAALPFLLGWFVSPAVAYFISRPRREAEAPLSDEERRFLRRLARKTWSFFETFVNAQEHGLPPDNYQQDPKGQVAHRTSPTNMGLYLLSSLAAQDLGYLTHTGLADRLEQTFDTFDRLDRFRGHFYNWYDTHKLTVLTPPYVSTVDSGNLLGCLLTLKQGLVEKTHAPLDPAAVRAGLLDTLDLIQECVQAIEPPTRQDVDLFPKLDVAVKELAEHLAQEPADLLLWHRQLEWLDRLAQELVLQVQALALALREEPEDLQRWSRFFVLQVQAQRRELEALAPWLPRCHGAGATSAESTTPLHDLWSRLPAENTERWRTVCAALTRFASLTDLVERQEWLLTELDALASLVPGAPGSHALRGTSSTDAPRPVFAAEEDAERPAAAVPTQSVGTREAGAAPAVEDFLVALRADVQASAAPRLLARLRELAKRAQGFADAMDFRFLYNAQRHLFTIGYNSNQGRLDPAHYDLLASESCLTSFLAVARGDVPRRHWFQLGRQLTRAPHGEIALISWGGTMFEYLMPRLMMRAFDSTLLAESMKGAVDRQIEYGRHNRVPWGISESGFNALDAGLDYQYQSFGVPGLGLKRGLSRDLVVAPYSTFLALMIRPHAALANLRRLQTERAEGPYGLYEAIDYTRDRLRKKRRSAVVYSFMAHHQGMSLLALTNALLGEPMPRRFHAEPLVRATELLLQERVPRVAPLLEMHEDEASPMPVVRDGVLPMSRRLTTADTPHPRTHLLSNGRYSVMLTNAGGGYSACQDFAVTRWREDATSDSWGQFLYIRDTQNGQVWSAACQPLCSGGTGVPPVDYEVIYSTDKAEFRRRDGTLDTHLEVTVSPESPAEVRRLTFTNHGNSMRELEVTSYAEIVLAAQRGDLAHPAFGKLFLETEFLPEAEALLCRRRPRSAEQKPVWCVHVLAVDGGAIDSVQYETDRARFLGRGRTTANPAALDAGVRLSGSTGPVLDPIVSLRHRVRVAPGASVSLAFTTAVAFTRQEALALADHYHDFHGVHRAFELAWAHTQVQLRHLGLSAEEVHLYQRLAAHILYASPTLRAPANVLAANHLGQPGLWRHGISGDWPIVLARVSESEELQLVRQLLQAHAYWRLRGLKVDLVLLNEHPTAYTEEVRQQLQGLIRASDAHDLIDKPGGIFLLQADRLSQEDLVLLQSAARVVLAGNAGSLAAQVDRQGPRVTLPAAATFHPTEGRARMERWRKQERTEGQEPITPGAAQTLVFANGYGGFTGDGREYQVRLPASLGGARGEGRGASEDVSSRPFEMHLPPAPWSNVVANPRCGFLVSESGGGYTWASNSQQNRLTPWNNDPVSDPPGEVIYLRDEESGELWTPTPLPLGAGVPNLVRHGQGYTLFEQTRPGLSVELLLFVPVSDPVKVMRLRVRNTGTTPRRLSATFFAEWVLGTVRDAAPMQVITERDADRGAVLARNPFQVDFPGAVAFAGVNQPHSCTGDRTEFLGRNGSVRHPAALERVELSGRVGAGLDPCAALMTPFEIAPGAVYEVVFLLGEGSSLEETQRLLDQYRQPAAVQSAYEEATRFWDNLLGTVQVRTPNAGMDLLLNRWLLYQVLSCRVWGRSAFYQSGGAYGFRDQLQDVMALVCAAPSETRAQLLRAASRQFLEGDVQHWWHPPIGRGVRTRFSDDLLWLPFVTAHYVHSTGDTSVLDEQVRFLRAPVLRPEQEEDYGLPETTEETASLYEHCVRAIDHGLRFGPHGLPLMGTGDWNDGMNRVGPHRKRGESEGGLPPHTPPIHADGESPFDWDGKGESVWDGWFLLTLLPRFAELAERRGDARAARYREEAARLQKAMEEKAWDGGWYRRAYFDDGTPLGSAENDECQIDSLPQSWAAISGAGDPERARLAMAAVEQKLVRPEEGLILLFTPPFDRGVLQPGYIKGYVPGIRENGGQYTHAATWVVQATALLGHGTRAVELFDLLSPVAHTASPEAVARYKVEPYVVAADVYGVPPHVGRGGWTWYTGSAAWLYRVAVETILGLRLEGGKLRVEPCIPAAWPRYEMTFQHRAATYHIVVENPQGVERGIREVTVDGAPVAVGGIALAEEGAHEVRVVLGKEGPATS